MTDHSLTLGSLLLTESVEDATHGFVFNVLANGMSTGSGAAVKEIVTSLLADGDLVRITRYGNREVSFQVEITGPTLGALAHGEAALRAEVGHGNTLTWQAPDVLSVPTVFEVVASEMAQTFDDLDELRRRRTFVVSLTCSPAARSADLVTVDALAPPSVAITASVTTADTTAGFTAYGVANNAVASVSPTDMGAYVQATLSGSPAQALRVVYAAPSSVSMATTRYLVIEASGTTPTHYRYNGAYVTPVLIRATTAGTVLHIIDSGFADLTSFEFSVGGNSPSYTFNIHDAYRTDTLPQVSPRQLTRVISVGGTERTPASIHVQSANGTDALTQAIVHTCPEDGSGYSPPLQRWRTVGQTRTADATAFSGNYESINTTSWIAEVPTSALPEGGYVLLARLRAQTAGVVSITWSTSTIFPDAVTQQGFTVGAFNHDFAVGNEWELVPIEVLSLPSVRTKAGKVQIALQVAAASPVVTLDEAWLFRDDDDCALTIVETDQPHLWLDSPDITSPVPRIWVGDGVDTKVHPGEGLGGMGAHVLSPEGTAVFTAALTDYPATDATFYRRWHSNAAS
jgi:hypothetical protein